MGNMKKRLLSLIVIIAVLGSISASERSDELAYMYKTISQLHPAIYTNISKTDLDRSYDELVKNADNLNEIDYAIAISEFLANVKDGHTYCGFSERIYSKMNFLPLKLYDDGENITIFAAADDSLVGKTISSINGNPIVRVIEKLGDLFSADTAVYRRMQSVMNLVVTDFLSYLKIVNSPEEAVTIGFADGSSASLLPVSRDAYINADLKYSIRAIAPSLQINGYYSLRTFDEGIYFLPYNTCASDPDFPLDTFIDRVESYIAQNPPKALIIDLRNNGGGDSSLLNPLITWLSGNIMKYGFKLYVFIGNQTFSSAVLNAGDLLAIEGAVSVGSETGGSASHFGEIRQFSLPYSGIGITVSSKLFGDRQQIGKGITPDVRVTNTYEDYVTGHDRAYEYVLSEVR